MTRTRVRDHIIVSVLFASILFPVCSNAQWNANLTLTAPSPYLSDWSSRRNTATLLVTNSTGLFGNIKILADIELNGDLVAFTKPEKVEIRTIQPGQSQLFFGEAIVPYSAIHFEGNIDQSTQRAGRVPDGVICVHVKVVDAQTGALLDDDYKCATIISFLPAYLQLPEDGSILCRLGEHNIIEMNSGNPRPMFRWTPVVPAPSEPVRYQLKIFEVLAGQNHTTAFRSARPLFERELLGTTELIWPVEYFYPEAGKRYVWSVRAIDAQGRPLVRYQDGWATPFFFTVVEECREGNIDIDNDRIPDVTGYGKPFDYQSDIKVRITEVDPSPLDPDVRHEFNGAARSRLGGPFVFRWFIREHGSTKFMPMSSSSNTAKLILAPSALKPNHDYDLRLTAERNGIFGEADLLVRTGESSEPEASLDIPRNRDEDSNYTFFFANGASTLQNGKREEFGKGIGELPAIRLYGNTIELKVSDGKEGYILKQFDFPDASLPEGTYLSQHVNRMYDNKPALPNVCKAELRRKCDNGAISLFWGEVFSITNDGSTQRSVDGKPASELHQSNSISIQHGWVYDCKKGKFIREFSVQYSGNNNGNEEQINAYSEYEEVEPKC